MSNLKALDSAYGQGDSKEVLTVILPECEAYMLALNAPTKGQGFGIKDLKLTEGLSAYLESVMPKRPDLPKPPAPKNGKSYDNEETKANTQLMLDCHKANEELNQKEFQIGLNQFQKGLLKQKMASCLSFPGESGVRKFIVSAAEKVGA